MEREVQINVPITPKKLLTCTPQSAGIFLPSKPRATQNQLLLWVLKPHLVFNTFQLVTVWFLGYSPLIPCLLIRPISASKPWVLWKKCHTKIWGKNYSIPGNVQVLLINTKTNTWRTKDSPDTQPRAFSWTHRVQSSEQLLQGVKKKG